VRDDDGPIPILTTSNTLRNITRISDRAWIIDGSPNQAVTHASLSCDHTILHGWAGTLQVAIIRDVVDAPTDRQNLSTLMKSSGKKARLMS
jgi:hypothetical protein